MGGLGLPKGGVQLTKQQKIPNQPSRPIRNLAAKPTRCLKRDIRKPITKGWPYVLSLLCPVYHRTSEHTGHAARTKSINLLLIQFKYFFLLHLLLEPATLPILSDGMMPWLYGNDCIAALSCEHVFPRLYRYQACQLHKLPCRLTLSLSPP